MKEVIANTFFSNLQRVRDLTSLQMALQSFPGISESVSYGDDVLRSSVVFLHASLEELVRGIISWKIPQKGKNQIDKIPLLNNSTRNQPKPFKLGDLVEYRDMQIDELIQKSVDEHLNYTNYNRVEDIITFLEDLEIGKDDFQDIFSDLGQIMRRRHLIVHRADRNNSREAESDLNIISNTEVTQWISTINIFGEKLLEKL